MLLKGSLKINYKIYKNLKINLVAGGLVLFWRL